MIVFKIVMMSGVALQQRITVVYDSDSSNDDVTCTGCMDSAAANFDPFATIPCSDCCSYDAFSYNQSMKQAFYFFTGCTINGDACVEGEDEVYAFNGSTCVGGGVWGGTSIEIPVMGSDGTAYTDNYLSDGDVPTFRILDVSSGSVYDAVMDEVQGAFGNCDGYPDPNGDGVTDSDDCTTFPAWSNFGTFHSALGSAIGTIDAIQDCNNQVGGHAYTDDCSDCSGGGTGLGLNHNDPDSDTVCNDGAANGEADNCPDVANCDVPGDYNGSVGGATDCQWNHD